MGAKARSRVDLLTHRDIAARCSIDPETLREWVHRGVWPEPHSIIERTWFFRAETVEHWLETGEWPEGAKFRAGEGRGRVRDDP